MRLRNGLALLGLLASATCSYSKSELVRSEARDGSAADKPSDTPLGKDGQGDTAGPETSDTAADAPARDVADDGPSEDVSAMDGRVDAAGVDGTGVDVAGVDGTGVDGTGVDSHGAGILPGPLPASCEQLASSVTADGDYTLHLGGAVNLPFKAHCYHMTTAPETYLTLVNTTAGHNFSQYSTTLLTTYTRIHFNPDTMLVDIADRTFANTSGTGGWAKELPYGTAACCEAPYKTACGTSNVDLGGLPFTIVTTWRLGGSGPVGVATPGTNKKTVDANGGGGCGWNGPGSPDPSALTSSSEWWTLQLAYDYPASCEMLAQRQTHPVDGEYTLYLGGAPNHPFKAYCYDMTTVPKTYLTLIYTGSGYNFAQYGTAVKTSYTRLRFDPDKLLVDIADRTFATTTGTSASIVTMPYGTAACCDGGGLACGSANVNLQGLPFLIASPWQLGGTKPGGAATVSTDKKSVVVTGGGACGWNGPSSADPSTLTSASTWWNLQLAYDQP